MFEEIELLAKASEVSSLGNNVWETTALPTRLRTATEKAKSSFSICAKLCYHDGDLIETPSIWFVFLVYSNPDFSE